ncbi:NAD(P)H-hydrate dehydratase [Planctellipticum variicoloris]|uniref:NAD(P)H-hydrate dehydratase n=1 Tax=Planctellipticum variicoloris TaxID=3064265 RepID=UPI00301398D0|nr:NAD(P)H-hydrate dehydratase [Planctomycetaceae bacterium SH412]
MSAAPELVTRLPAVPPRPVDSHKGTFGRTLIIAGSRGMSGAACLAGLGALRGGAGLVYVAVPVGIQSIVAGYEPSYLTCDLPEDGDGQLAASAFQSLQPRLSGMSAVAIGPGLGQSPGVQHVVRHLYTTAACSLVVDADGLNALAGTSALDSFPTAARILTPHPGEFARLSGLSLEEIQSSRETVALEFARRSGTILLLKGASTVVTDGRRLAINDTGNPGMATGGCGDVLTGVIAALLAQGISPFEAAQLGAWLHGRAGDMAAEHLSCCGLIASDLPRYVARAWNELPR